MNIPIVYEDDWLLVVDKPSGLLVIPSPRNEKRTLTSIINDDLKAKGVAYRAHPAHRLDRETSGLLIYAKGKSSQKKMMQEFAQKSVHKTYIAFVQGNIRSASGTINTPIEKRPALTKFKLLTNRKNYAVVEAIPLTGRTNQLRIHFKEIGHPIVGETKFAFRKDFTLKYKRLCLHAKGLEFKHPVTGKRVILQAELAADMAHFLESHAD